MIYVLDTDHISLHQRGYEPLKRHLSNLSPDHLCMTIVSAEELLRGRLAQIRRVTRPDERIQGYHWLSETIAYLRRFHILPYDSRAEACFQTFLEQKIRIGTQDLKIAAIAVSRNAVLVTRNRKDFERVFSLCTEDWSK